MIISLRAKSEMNLLQKSSILHLLHKCTFHVFRSHMTLSHDVTFVATLNKISSHNLKITKHQFQRRCIHFSYHFLLDFDVARSEIIIKSSFEIHQIVNE